MMKHTSFGAAALVLAAGCATPGQAPPWGDPASRSFLIPAAEIVGFEYLLNLYDRNYDKEDAYTDITRAGSSSCRRSEVRTSSTCPGDGKKWGR